MKTTTRPISEKVSGTSLVGGGALLNSRMLLGGVLNPPSTNN